MRFLHTADIHIGAAPDAGHPWSEERAEAIARVPEKLAEICRREKIDLLLLAGDIFHFPPTEAQLTDLRDVFDTMPETRVVMIAGEHDFVRPASAYARFIFGERVTFLSFPCLSSVVFPQWNLEVHGFSYSRRTLKENRLDNLTVPADGKRHILLAHGGDEDHLPIDTDMLLAQGWTYVALGHCHKPGISTEGRLAYPGSPEPVSADETGTHGYYLGELTGKSLSVTWKPFSACSYETLRLTLNTSSTQKDLEQRILRQLSNAPEHIFSVTLTGESAPDFRPDCEALARLGRIRSVRDDSVPALEGLEREAFLAERREKLLAQCREIDAQEKEDLLHAAAVLEDRPLPAPREDFDALSAGRAELTAALDTLEQKQNAISSKLERKKELLKEFKIPAKDTVQKDLKKLADLKEYLIYYDEHYDKPHKLPAQVREVLSCLCLISGFLLFVPLIKGLRGELPPLSMLALPVSIFLFAVYTRLGRDLDSVRVQKHNLEVLDALKERYLPTGKKEETHDEKPAGGKTKKSKDEAKKPAEDEAKKPSEPPAELAATLEGYLKKLLDLYGFLARSEQRLSAIDEEKKPLLSQIEKLDGRIREVRNVKNLRDQWELKVRAVLTRLEEIRAAEEENASLRERADEV